MPEEAELLHALESCTSALWESPTYAYFVDAKNPDPPGSRREFDRNVVLEDAPEGFIVLDILKDGRVGGVEYTHSAGVPDASKVRKPTLWSHVSMWLALLALVIGCDRSGRHGPLWLRAPVT